MLHKEDPLQFADASAWSAECELAWVKILLLKAGRAWAEADAPKEISVYTRNGPAEPLRPFPIAVYAAHMTAARSAGAFNLRKIFYEALRRRSDHVRIENTQV
jgi:hypothetical protein